MKAQLKSKTIKVQYVNPPKSSNGPGSIKADDGNYYKVWEDLEDFQVNQSYIVGYSTEVYNGKDQFTVREKAIANGADPFPPSENVKSASFGATPTTIVHPQQYAAEDHRNENIFVNMWIKEGIHAGKIDVFSPSDGIRAGKTALEVLAGIRATNLEETF